jgi:hypothetical protein
MAANIALEVSAAGVLEAISYGRLSLIAPRLLRSGKLAIKTDLVAGLWRFSYSIYSIH